MRREPVAAPLDVLPADAPARRRRLESVVVRAWGGQPDADSMTDTFARAGHVPAGVVLASTYDPAWTAAVALAAARGQPLLWLDDSLGQPNATLDATRAAALRRRVETLVAEAGYPFAVLGDAIEAITVCRSMAVACRLERVPVSQAGLDRAGADDPRAVTDLLGRNERWDRFAFPGWIFGDGFARERLAEAGNQLFRADGSYAAEKPVRWQHDHPWVAHAHAHH